MVSIKFGLAFVIGISLLTSVYGACDPLCTGLGADCVGSTCYCNADYWGANCVDTCAACNANEVCISATACGPCDPACYSPGGSCATVDTTPTCKCNTDFSGDDCRTITCSSATAPCQNLGTCAGGVCTCPETHAGLVCELACGACTGDQKCVEEGGNPVCKTKCTDNTDCENGGTCTAADLCDCATGWEGDLCTVIVCDPVCTTAEKCVEEGGSNVCKTKCTDNTDCENGGTCTAEVCNCATGWEGDLCDQAELVCDPVCTAAQKCVEEDGSKVCKTKCANNDACKNNGTCVSELCNCAEGWTGDLCTDSGVSVVPSVLSMALLMLVIRL